MEQNERTMKDGEISVTLAPQKVLRTNILSSSAKVLFCILYADKDIDGFCVLKDEELAKFIGVNFDESMFELKEKLLVITDFDFYGCKNYKLLLKNIKFL